MRFQCEHCQGISAVGPEDYGRQVGCGHCGKATEVPTTRYSPRAVINDFVLEKILGQGGMGTVFLAHQISLERPVALKVLRDELAKNSSFVVEFVKEARAAARLNHPNIVQSHAVGEEDGLYFFAMEYVQGQTLSAVLKGRGMLPPAEATPIIRQIAEALGYAWQHQQLVHRDVKPDNIMITDRGVAKLTDLGLARPAGEMWANEEVYGTPQYISPEQLLGEPVDTRTDLYCLGATFYHIVTGRFPFEGESANEIARQHLEANLVPPEKINPAVGAGLGAVILRMMSRDKADRYADAAALVADLDRVRRGEMPADGRAGKKSGNRAVGRGAKQAKDDAPTGVSVAGKGSGSMAGGKKITMRGGARSGAPTMRRSAGGSGASGAYQEEAPVESASAMPWVVGVVVILLVAALGIVGRSIYNKYTPPTPEAAETLYLGLKTLAPGERERYLEIKKFVGKEGDYLRNAEQLNQVADLARRFMIDFPNSLYTRTAEGIVYAEMFGAPKYFEEHLRKSASPLAGSVSQTRYAYDEIYVRIKRRERRAVEEADITKYRYAMRFKRMNERVVAWGEERQKQVSQQVDAVRGSLATRRDALEKEKAEMLSRSLDLGNMLEFALASKRAADAIALVSNYPPSVDLGINETVQGTEFDRTRTWRHQLAQELNLDVTLVGEAQQKVIDSQQLERLKQTLLPFIDEERKIMRERSEWLTGLSQSLQLAADYHDAVSGSGKKLNGLKVKLAKYDSKTVLRVQEVNSVNRETAVVYVKEWSEQGAWAVMETVNIALMDMPNSEYDKLALQAAGRVEQTTLLLRKGAFYFWRLQLPVGLENLRASGSAGARFMLDHEDKIRAQLDGKTVKWVSERIIRLLDAPAAADKKEADQKLELAENRRSAAAYYSALKEKYGSRPEWQDNLTLLKQAAERLQQ